MRLKLEEALIKGKSPLGAAVVTDSAPSPVSTRGYAGVPGGGS